MSTQASQSKQQKSAGPLIYIVDDDDSMREAIELLLRTVGYETMPFGRASEFLAKYNPDQHAVLVLDVRMPEMSGLEVQQQLNRAGAMLPVIFMTGHGDIPMAVQAMKDGAFDFLTKPFDRADLLGAVERALAVDARLLEREREVADVRAHFVQLTAREREVCFAVTDGLLNKQVGAEFGVSEKTIKVHRARVMDKMGATSLAELVRMADLMRADAEVLAGGVPS